MLLRWSSPTRRRSRSRPVVETLEGRAVLDGGIAVNPINFEALPPDGTGFVPTTVLAADLDSDGKVDRIVLLESESLAEVRRGNGDGTFAAPASFATGNGPGSGTLGDFNGDGKIDLAVGARFDGAISLLLGNGDGTFQAATNVAVDIDLSDIVAADFDADGRLDLATAHLSTGLIYVLYGAGDGTFAQPVAFLDVFVPMGLVAGDFTGDGAPDLAAANPIGEPDEVVLIPNEQLRNPNGPTLATHYAVGFSPVDLAAADLNGDGRLDLVTANSFSNDLSVLLGTPGPTAFANEMRVPAGLAPFRLVAADFNGDGRGDVGVSLETENRFAFFQGCGDGTFVAGQRPFTGSFPAGAAVADFDGDGRLDVTVGHINSRDVRTLLNRSGVVVDFRLMGPRNIGAGVGFNLHVAAVDSAGQVVPTYAGRVHFGSGDMQAMLPPDYTFLAGDLGVKTFGVTLKTAGPQPVVVNDVAKPMIDGALVVGVAPGPLASFRFVNVPPTTTAGTSFQFSLAPSDAFGNPVPGYSGTVHFTSSDPRAALPGDFTFDGQNLGPPPAFAATLLTAGTRTLTVTDVVNSTLTGSSPGVVIAPGPTVGFLFGPPPPPPLTAGAPRLFGVVAVDAFDNPTPNYAGTVRFTSSDPRAVLPDPYLFQPSDNGMKPFPVTFKSPGTHNLTVLDDGLGASRTLSGLAVVPGPVHHFNLFGPPFSLNAGQVFDLGVAAVDACNNPVPTFTGTVHFASTDGRATLPADYTFTANDGGVAFFPGGGVLRSRFQQTVFARDAAGVLGEGMVDTFVEPGPLAQLLLTSSGPAVAGQFYDVYFKAADVFGNEVRNYLRTITLTSDDPLATLPGPLTFGQQDGGIALFDVTFGTAGVHSLTVTDDGPTPLTFTLNGIPVVAGPPQALRIDAPTNVVVAGAVVSVTVSPRDVYGNLATGYRGTIAFTSDDPMATLPPPYMFAPDELSHTFDVTFRSAGPHTLSVVDDGQPPLTGSRGGIVVVAAAADHLRLVGPPTSVSAGQSIDSYLAVEDVFGNRVKNYTGTIHFVSDDPQGSVPPDFTFAPADGGYRLFPNSIVPRTAGVRTFVAHDTTGVLADGGFTLNVMPGPLAAVELRDFDPTLVVAGPSHSVLFVATDAFGNEVPLYQRTITFTSSDPRAALPSPFSFGAQDGGSHGFQVGFGMAGVQSLTVTDDGSTPLTFTLSGINVVAGPTYELRLDAPTDTVAGAAVPVTVSARDIFGNLASDYAETVTFTSDDPRATLPPPYSFSPGGGSHTFDVVFRGRGAHTLTATYPVPRRPQGPFQTSAAVTVQAGAAVGFVLDAPPVVAAGAPFPLTLTAFDAFGNIAEGYTGTIHFVASGPPENLPPDFTFAPSDGGRHTFTVALTKAGMRLLTVSDNVDPLSATVPVDVAPGLATRLDVAATGPVRAGEWVDFVVTAFDAFDNVATHFGGDVAFSSSDSRAILPFPYAFTPSDAGRYVFRALFGTAGPQTLFVDHNIRRPLVGHVDFVVAPGQLAAFGIDAPRTLTAGVPFTLTATALDLFGNLVTDYTGPAMLSSSDPRAAVPPTLAFAPDGGGRASVVLELRTAGPQAIFLEDHSVRPVGNFLDVTVLAAEARRFALSPVGNAIAGEARSVTLTAYDAFDNVADTYLGTVRFVCDDVQAILPPDYSFTAVDLGTHTFDVTFKTSGSRTLTVSDVNQPSLTVGEGGIAVAPGAAARFGLDGPATVVSGDAFDATLTALDSFGNVATGYSGTVRVTSDDTAASLPRDFAFSLADAGARSFRATLRTPGSRTLTATDAATPTIAQGLTVVVQPPPIVTVPFRLELATAPLLEGATAEFRGLLLGAALRVDVTATVEWGDGTPPTAFVVPAGSTFARATHVFADAGTFALRATLAADGFSGTATLDVVVDNRPPEIPMSRDVALEEGGMLERRVVLGGDTNVTSVVVDYGDGSPPVTLAVAADGSVLLRHRYDDEGTYPVRLTVRDDEGVSATDLFLTEVFLPGLTRVVSEPAAPGSTITLDTADADGTLVRGASDADEALLSIVHYERNPLPVDPEAGADEDLVVLSAEDVRLTNAAATDRLTVTIPFRRGDDGTIRLDFFSATASRYLPVRGSTAVADSLRIDTERGLVTVVLDATSFPAITDLRGTVFAVSVTTPQAQPTTVTPTVASTAAALTASAFSTSTSFTSTTSRSLSVTPSEDRGLGTAQASLNGSTGTVAASGEATGSGFAYVFPPQKTQAASPGEEAEAPSEGGDPWSLSDDVFSRWQPTWGESGNKETAPQAPPPVWPLASPGGSERRGASPSRDEEDLPWAGLAAACFVAPRLARPTRQRERMRRLCVSPARRASAG